MRYKKMLMFLLLSSFTVSCSHDPESKPVSIIFDTDIGPDYDDVGAITILHAMADRGETDILATIASNKYEGIAGILDVFNTYFGRPDIPIGVPEGEGVNIRDSQHWTDTLLAKYPHKIKSNNEVPGAVEVYRKVLAAQPDTSVTIVTVGFLTNLVNLLASQPDSFSSLNGRELIKKKVKQLVSMAGKFPSGKEFNVYNDAKAAQKVFSQWPTPVIFSGFEVGEKIKTGLPLVDNDQIRNDPAKDVFRISIPLSEQDSAGRMSWDETAVLVAVRGPEPYFTLQEGRINVNDDGSNSWDKQQKGQYYLVPTVPPEKIAAVIDELMMHQPERKGK